MKALNITLRDPVDQEVIATPLDATVRVSVDT